MIRSRKYSHCLTKNWVKSDASSSGYVTKNVIIIAVGEPIIKKTIVNLKLKWIRNWPS